MADEEEKKEGEGAEGAAPKKSKKLIIIVAVVAVLANAGGAFFFLAGSKAPTDEEVLALEEQQHEQESATEAVELDTFIVNLSENATFLKTTIVLQVNAHLLHSTEHSSAGGGGGHGEGGGSSKLPGILGMKEPLIKDKVIKILSSKKAPQLLDPEGKDELKQELADAINQVVELDEELVSNVFFVTFIIQ